MGAPNNNVKYPVRLSSMFERVDQSMITSSTTWNQGDLLVYDATNHRVARASDETANITLLGIARQSIVNGQEVQPVSTLSQGAIAELAGPQFGGVFTLNLKVGDAFYPGAPVYGDPSDGNNFVSITGTKTVGVYQGPAITAAAGDTGPVLIGHRFPNDSLQF
jgi:hypothetical protein